MFQLTSAIKRVLNLYLKNELVAIKNEFLIDLPVEYF